MIRRKKLIIWIAAVLAVVGLGFVVWPMVEVRIAMSVETHPVWRALDSGEFRAGSDLADLIAAHPPSRRDEYGSFVILTYIKDYDPNAKVIWFAGLGVTAHDGRLVSAEAGSCTWRHGFFDIMTDEQNAELGDLLLSSLPNQTEPSQ